MAIDWSVLFSYSGLVALLMAIAFVAVNFVKKVQLGSTIRVISNIAVVVVFIVSIFQSGLLSDAGFDETFIHIILSHGYGFDCADLLHKKRTEKIEHALAAGETITGLIHAYALMRGKKISDMDAKGLLKKYKDKKFAQGCDREIIAEIEHVGIPLEEFFKIAIEAISGIKEEVGLA